MLRRGFLGGVGATLVAACSSPKPVAQSTAEAAYPPVGDIVDLGDGRKVHAVIEGAASDAPPLVLLHGASGNVRDWTFDLSRRLAQGRIVASMDRPGHGYSSRTGERAWRPGAQAEQLADAVRKLGLERPIVVGHSWGAAVALAWALDRPEDVSGVVAVSGAMMPWGGIVPTLSTLGVSNLVVGYYNARLTNTAETGGVEDFINRAFRPQTPPAGYVEHVGAPLALRASTLEANGDDLSHTHDAVAELAPRYASLKVPLEVVHGDADWLLDFDQHAAGIAGIAPDVRLTRLAGVGHMAHHARPDALEAAIARLTARA